MRLSSLIRGLVAAALALGAAAASAAVVYTFDSSDVGEFEESPYGTVTLVQNGSNVDVTVSLRSDLDFVLTGNHSIFSFNVDGATVDDITNIAFQSGPKIFAGIAVLEPGVNPPFGTFDLMVDCTSVSKPNDCGGQGQTNAIEDPLTFTVLNATYADFGRETTGGNGNTPASFAADVVCQTGSCDGKTGSIGVTGEGSDTDLIVIHEPGTVALVGLGLLGAAAARRRQRS